MVANELALRDRFFARPAGEEHLVEVGQLQRCSELPLAGRPECGELLQLARPAPAMTGGDRPRSPRAALTSSLVRPLFTDVGWSSGFHPGTAWSSLLWSSNHCSFWCVPPPNEHEATLELLAIEIEVEIAGSMAVTGSSAFGGAQVPQSQTITSPPPYSPRE